MKKFIMFFSNLLIFLPLNVYALSGDEIYSLRSPSIYTLYGLDKNQKTYALGSAVAVGNNILATNCHVALYGNVIFVKIQNNYEVGLLLYKDQKEDLCLVKIENANFKPVQLRESKNVTIGEEIYTIGNPEGIEKTMSKGIISNKREVDQILYLQIDAPITSGSSGGGLFDKEGNLLGITTWRETKEGDLNFAIPSDYINNILGKNLTGENSHSVKQNEISAQSEIPQITAPSNSSEGVKKIGDFGKDKVELYQIDQLCFILIHGRTLNGDLRGTSLWIPQSPKKILLYPMANSISEILSVMNKDEKNNNNFVASYSFLLLDNTIYKLIGKPNGDKFPILVAYFDENPANKFIDGDYIVMQSKDPTNEEGFNTIVFGLYGFSEAMAVYRTTCKSAD